MIRRVTLEMLDAKAAFEVIPDQNVETCIRFTLPVPNWLGEDGQPVFDHPHLKYIGKNGAECWRFSFFNYTDRCEQGVKVDGTGVIIFTAPTPQESERLLDIIKSYRENPADLTPWDIEDILHVAKEELGLGDRYNDNVKNCEKDLHPAFPGQVYVPLLGAMLKRPRISSALYIGGSGAFVDGAAVSPQLFSDGAFILFPDVRKEAVADYIVRKIAGDQSVSIKLVQPEVFVASRTLASGELIDIERLRRRDDRSGPGRNGSASPCP